MATTTINGFGTLVTSLAANDLIAAWRVSQGDSVRITKANAIGATITGGGTIATGGHTLTVSDDSEIDGTFVGGVTNGGVIDTGGFNVSFPVAGAVAMLDETNLFTVAQEMSSTLDVTGLITADAGITFGEQTLDKVRFGTYTPAITGSSSNPTVTYTTQIGEFFWIGPIVFYYIGIVINTISGGSGDARFSLPYTVKTGYNPYGNVSWANVDVPGSPVTVGARAVGAAQYAIINSLVDNSTPSAVQISGLSAGDGITINGQYFVSS